jgi:hypothetical protein
MNDLLRLCGVSLPLEPHDAEHRKAARDGVASDARGFPDCHRAGLAPCRPIGATAQRGFSARTNLRVTTMVPPTLFIDAILSQPLEAADRGVSPAENPDLKADSESRNEKPGRYDDRFENRPDRMNPDFAGRSAAAAARQPVPCRTLCEKSRDGASGASSGRIDLGGRARPGQASTLVFTNEMDFRVPLDQGLQLFAALRHNGVPSKALCSRRGPLGAQAFEQQALARGGLRPAEGLSETGTRSAETLRPFQQSLGNIAQGRRATPLRSRQSKVVRWHDVG